MELTVIRTLRTSINSARLCVDTGNVGNAKDRIDDFFDTFFKYVATDGNYEFVSNIKSPKDGVIEASGVMMDDGEVDVKCIVENGEYYDSFHWESIGNFSVLKEIEICEHILEECMCED